MFPLNKKLDLALKNSTNLHSSNSAVKQDVIKALLQLTIFASLPAQAKQVFENELVNLLHAGCWPALADPLVTGGVFVVDQLSSEEQIVATLAQHPNISVAFRTFLQEARRERHDCLSPRPSHVEYSGPN
ncbi:MAG: hypothetical protein WC028_09885 [Candidatus Obscuribacterales bacterium]|jgi:hypothetical protein|nr:hypothetical protein [bacterium]MDQ5937096.1 hypothetical protein [Cyanobacteriota bacterium erpe_2018_sw_21hr_WHONDRS-SW48-000092_B_bin.40]